MALFSAALEFPEKTMVIVSHDPDLKAIADHMLYIRDGNISHTFTKEELVSASQSNEGNPDPSVYSPSNPNEVNERVLMELREINHIIMAKINQIEKTMHPV